MAELKQANLFGEEAESVFPEDAPAPVYRADPDRVRARLHRILGQMREAGTMPWDAAGISLYRTIFPQMTRWLPDEEAARLRCEFEAELARLTGD